MKFNYSLKNGGGNLLKEVVADILADGTRLFHCGEIKLRNSNLFHCQGEEGFGRLCHAEFISASLSGAFGQICRNKFGMTINHNKCRHPELVSGSLTERIGEFPSPREENLCISALAPCARGVSFKCAFTLAEVLITLGIIGVVAAITIPSLINNYKVKVLKTQFIKMESTIQQALLKTSNELGSPLSDFYGPGAADPNLVKPACLALEEQVPELNEVWLNQFSGLQRISRQKLIDMTHNHCSSVFNAKTNLGTWKCYSLDNTYLLANGSSISALEFSWYGRFTLPCSVSFMFDTNGPLNGPNRLGYDVFKYESYEYWMNSLCDPNVNNSENGYGCYYYAHRNKNPKDSSRPYWDILYKPSTYWLKSGK